MNDLRSKLLPAFTFAGAFLMFVLEPLVGRLLLPAYGGGFHVWTTCLMFFQGVLLLGYCYAHLVAPRIGRWHLLVACLPLALLPVNVIPVPDPDAPIASILVALLARIALPIGVLSTTGVMAQTWLARTSRAGSHKDPYWLYAASNAGSLIGLLAYPLLVEPFFGVAAQRFAWSALYLGYVALGALVAPPSNGAEIAADHGCDDDARIVPAQATTWMWFTLSAAPSIMLMAVTNAISFDVGSIPLVWVAPLALYLTTFILVFRTRQIYPALLRNYWPEAALAGIVALAAAPLFPSWPRIGVHLLALFAVCLAGHAELHRLRPHARDLTKYYLVISLGGWAGGVFVSLAAPALFHRLFEYPIAIFLLCGAIAWSRRDAVTHDEATPAAPAFRLQTAVRAPLAVTALAFAATWMLPGGNNSTRLMLLRNHYGIYQVGELPAEALPGDQAPPVTVRHIVHNGTIHGGQVVTPGHEREPIGYYHPAGGLGDVVRSLEGSAFKLGVVGLGAGGTTAHIGADDEIVFYEIDPDGEDIARRWFSYLSGCPGSARVVIGDARLMLAADPLAPDGAFDVFLVDAFNGDAIPTHLLTREAIELYRRKVKPGGLLVFHITNRFYDLRPVLEASRGTLGMHAAYKTREPEVLEPLERRTRYWVMSDDASAIQRFTAAGWTRADDPEQAIAPVREWTDDFVNVLAPLGAQLAATKW